ncbi:MAG: hypothetical protein QY303_10410 [Vicingaceae bacterium]|nr:MAG: hypothetical protein QY303_10410 [Vicingaceae bacterium]
MVDKDKLNDYKQCQKEWREISVTQLSNTNNVLLTLSSGLMAFCFNKNTITNIYLDLNHDISWIKATYLIAILLLAVSMCYGISVLISRLYDFRISRHIALTRQRVYEHQDGKTLNNDDLGEFGFFDRLCAFCQVVFCKLPFIKIHETKKSDYDQTLNDNFKKLRKLSKVLGNASWRWTKLEVIFFLLSCLTYFIHKIILQ